MGGGYIDDYEVYENIEEAMDEYARQEIIAFETWRRQMERDGDIRVYGKIPEVLYELYLKKKGQ